MKRNRAHRGLKPRVHGDPLCDTQPPLHWSPTCGSLPLQNYDAHHAGSCSVAAAGDPLLLDHRLNGILRADGKMIGVFFVDDIT